jgi:hypothetical protein
VSKRHKLELAKAYGRPLDMENEGEFFTDPSIDRTEKRRHAQVGRVVTQDGIAKGGLVLSYRNGLHQVVLNDGTALNLIWIWSNENKKDPAGISSCGWQLYKEANIE